MVLVTNERVNLLIDNYHIESYLNNGYRLVEKSVAEPIRTVPKTTKRVKAVK